MMIKKLKPLRDEATEYEVACKAWECVDKINELVEAVNSLLSQPAR